MSHLTDAQQMMAMARNMSVTLTSLVGMSVVVLAIGLERLLTLLLTRRRLRESHVPVVRQLREHDAERAQAANESLPRHAATPLYTLLLGPERHTTGALKRAQGRVVRGTRKRLWILGSVGSIAPFVGLLGTVLGVMDAFRAIGAEGAGGFAVVSSGISEALVTTAAGIFVGVESVLLFNGLQVIAASYAAELRDCLEEIAERLDGADRGA